MSTANISPAFSPLSWRRLGLSLVAAIGVLNLPLTAQDADEKPSNITSVRAGDDSVFTITPQGNVSIVIPRAPTSSSGAKLMIVNSNDYAIWTGPLTRSGNAWTTKIDRKAAEALLVANAAKAAFPGAAAGGKDLQVGFLREQFQSQMGALAGLVGSDPMFYDAPSAPTPLDMPSALKDKGVAASFAMAARRYDEQLSAYYNQLIAKHAGASSLWNDLKTAGRVSDWPSSAISAQDNAFKALMKARDDVMAKQKAARQKATALVQAWNSSNSGDPVDLTYRDAS